MEFDMTKAKASQDADRKHILNAIAKKQIIPLHITLIDAEPSLVWMLNL